MQLSIILVFFALMSCEKETNPLTEGMGTEVASIEQQSEGKYRKDVKVTDESGENTVFFAIYSDDEDLLLNYINGTNFSLKINQEDIKVLSKTKPKDQVKLNPNSKNINLDEEPKITIELLTTNLQADVKTYSLSQSVSNSKSAMHVSVPVAYTTTGGFIGLIHKGTGYSFLVKTSYKDWIIKNRLRTKWKSYEVYNSDCSCIRAVQFC